MAKFWVQKDFMTVDNSYRWPNNRVWWKWDWYQLGYSIIFKLGQMLHGQMLTVQMSPRQLRIHTDGLTIKPLKFGWVLTSNSGYMASYLLLNYRDPKKKKTSRHCSLKSEFGKQERQSNWKLKNWDNLNKYEVLLDA